MYLTSILSSPPFAFQREKGICVGMACNISLTFLFLFLFLPTGGKQKRRQISYSLTKSNRYFAQLLSPLIFVQYGMSLNFAGGYVFLVVIANEGCYSPASHWLHYPHI